MPAEIDSLEIKISAEANKANQAINSLVKSLEKLSASLKFDTSSLEKLGSINGNNIKNLGVGIKTLSSGLKDLQGIKKSDFNKLASGIERLSTINPGNMETVGNALKPLAQGINVLSNAKFDNKNLTNLINSLTRLSNANVGSLASVDFSTLGTKIKDLATALSGADKVEQNTISMTNAIAKLANAGTGAGAVTTALPQLGAKLKEFMNTMSRAPEVGSETIAFTQAIGTLANAGKKAETTANSLKKLGDELLKFFQTMSGAPNISQNTIQMTQALSNLANAGGKAGSAAEGLGNAFSSGGISANAFNSGINKLSKSMNGLSGSLGKAMGGLKSFSKQVLSAMGVTLGIYGVIRGIRKAMDISSDLTEVQNVVDVTFGDMAYKVEEFAQNSIEQFGMSELSLKQYSSRFQSMGTAMGIGSKNIEKANAFLNEQTDGYVGLSDSMADVSLNLTKLTADMASLYNVDQKVVAEKMASVFTGQTRPLRDYGLDLTQATLQEWALKNGMDANIQSMSQAEKTMLRYQYVMANTTAAHGDFARTANTWANQIRILKQNFEQLASVIGGVLVNAFKPVVKAINSAMSHIISFAKTISNALGKIFGWTYEEGGGGLSQDFGDAADSADDLSGSTGEAAKNIDKMKKGLRAFDELKTIDFPDPTETSGGGVGAGGGAGGGTGAEGGKWTQGESILKTFESEIDSLEKLGGYIADALSKAMEGIDWDSVYKKASGFGKGLAEFMNGLFAGESGKRLFKNIGKSIANAINAVLTAIHDWGALIKWKEIGANIGHGVNSFFKNWKPELTAGTFNVMAKGILDAMISGLETIEWKNIGQKIADLIEGIDAGGITWRLGKLVNSMANALYQLVSNKDTWKNLGQKISDGINGFVKGMNEVDKKTGLTGWQALAEDLNGLVSGIGTALKTAMSEIKWEEILSGIGEFLSSLDSETILAMIGVAAIKKFGKNVGKAIKDNMGIKLTGVLVVLHSFKKTFEEGGVSGLKNDVITSLEAGIGTFAITGNVKISLLVAGVEFAISGIVAAGNWLGKKFAESVLNANEEDGSKVWEMPDVTLSQAFKTQIKMDFGEGIDPKVKKEAERKINVWAKKNKLEWTVPFIDIVLFKDFDALGEKIKGLFKGIIDWIEEAFENSYLGKLLAALKVINGEKSTEKKGSGEKKYGGTGKGFEKSGSIMGGGGRKFLPVDIKTDKKQAQKNVNDTIEGINKGNETKNLKTKTVTDGKKDAENIYVNTQEEIGEKVFHAETKSDTSGSAIYSVLQAGIEKYKFHAETKSDTSGSAIYSVLQAGIEKYKFHAETKSDTSGSAIYSVLQAGIEKYKFHAETKSDTTGGELFDITQAGFSSKNLSTGISTTSASSVFNGFEESWNSVKKSLGLSVDITTGTITGTGASALKKALGFTLNADGGIFTGGSWKKITKYATGGFPDMGQLFVAREAGPELVGTIGGHTAVMNNNQIVSSVAYAVEEASYRGMMRALGSQRGKNINVTFQVEGDPNGIFKVTQKKAQEYFDRTGNPAYAM